ncbi:DUF2155 domain-containing protein [Phenylobacterium sp.]|uniref:DUF2155 domain-containing protein n=1 Tax=Phenylobacterium sp. TaxID=1871053 RepID=UPI00301C9472
MSVPRRHRRVLPIALAGAGVAALATGLVVAGGVVAQPAAPISPSPISPSSGAPGSGAPGSAAPGPVETPVAPEPGRPVAEEAPPVTIALPPPPVAAPPVQPGEVAPAPPPKDQVAEKPVEAPTRRARYEVAVIQALDKITAETLRFEARVGAPVRWKGLVFTVRACERSAPDEAVADSIVYLTIDAQPRPQPGRPTPPAREAFRGWMFAASPSLNPLEHPIYDAWAISCRTSSPVVAAAPTPAPKAAPADVGNPAAPPVKAPTLPPGPQPTARPSQAAPSQAAPSPASPTLTLPPPTVPVPAPAPEAPSAPAPAPPPAAPSEPPAPIA